MNENNKKLIIGLDLGIASVGISVVDKDTKKIIHRQSHLFQILSKPKTLTSPGGYGEGARGDKRRQRRTIQRRKQRRLDFISLINDTEIKSGKRKGEIRKANPEYKAIFNFNADVEKNVSYPIYELAVKGLTSELTPKELFKVLYSKLSFRGVNFTLPNEDENLLSVAEELLDILNKNKKLRSPSARVILDAEKTNNKAIPMQFSLKRNKKDLVKIIDNCSYLKGTNFKNDFLGDDESDDIVIKSGIFSRVRDFSQGPGSEKSTTDYGVYKKDGQQVNNLWEESIGKCPVHTEQQRSLKCQSLPEIANLLSQLNSMKISNEKLTPEQKEKVISNVIKELAPPSPTKIINWLKLDKNSLTHYPKSKDGKKHNIEKCENLIRLYKRQVLIFIDFAKAIEEIYYVDKITSKHLIHFYNKDELVNANKDYKLSILEIKKYDHKKIIKNYEDYCRLNPVTTTKTPEVMSKELENFQKNNISGTHSFSLLALKEYINKNINDIKSMSTFYRKETNIFEMNQYSFEKNGKKIKYINNRLMDNVDFISPNIKNTMSECCKLVNKVLKKYVYNGSMYDLDAIIIETTNDTKYALNGLENNKAIIKEQIANEKIKAEIKNQYPSIKDVNIEKIILLRKQQGIDLYDGKSINELDVIDNPANYEIDHILPISRSQNNNRENKVITKTENNRSKGNKTPIEWLSSKTNFNDLKILWKEILNDEPKKLNFMEMENFSIKERFFIARNLTETQYIMRRIKIAFEAWKSYMKENFNNDNNIYGKLSDLEIITVSGSVTQRLRKEKYLNLPKKDRNVTQRLRKEKYLNLPKKDRNISLEHHSIDASICAVLGTIDEFRETIRSFIRSIDDETGEVKWAYNTKKPIDIFDQSKVKHEIWENLSKSISESNWWLSHKSSCKLNKCKTIEEKIEKMKSWKPKKLSGETIYGHIKVGGINKTKERYDLLELKDTEIPELKIIFQKSYEESKCLNANNYFESLKKIWNKYYDENNPKLNPFHKYMDEHKDEEDFRLAILKRCVKISDDNLQADISRLTFIGEKLSGIDLAKISNNAFITQLIAKCVYLIENKEGNKKFLNENWFNEGKRIIDEECSQIIDIIEIGTIYSIDGSLYRVTGCDKSNDYLQCSSIDRTKLPIKKPFSTFSKLNAKKINIIKN